MVSMAGYSKTPLLQKLGIKPGFKVYLINAPAAYVKSLGPFPLGVQVLAAPKPPLDFIHGFFDSRDEYEKRLPALKKALAPAGMIWVSWPKAASKVPTDLTETDVRNFGLKAGLIDIKVCAVDEIWSGLKFVIPVKARKR
jgi:hypothetical protein